MILSNKWEVECDDFDLLETFAVTSDDNGEIIGTEAAGEKIVNEIAEGTQIKSKNLI